MTTSETAAPELVTVHLLPVGPVPAAYFRAAGHGLARTFLVHCVVEDTIQLPPEAYEPSRRQFHAGALLELVRHHAAQQRWTGKTLGLTVADVFLPRLNFVFGVSSSGGSAALVATARLHPEFWGLPANPASLNQRIEKEAIHEVGHAFGLGHCANPTCVMRPSNRLLDTDRKSAALCDACYERCTVAR